MGWYEVMLTVSVVANVVLVIALVRVMLRNKKLRSIADEANSLRRLADAAEQRNRQIKQEMTSNIAHELKTPVASIMGYMEILLGDKPVDEQRRRHFIERSYLQTKRLSELIQDVSLINKIEESAELFPKERVDVSSVVVEAVEDLEERMEARKMTVENGLGDGLWLNGNKELLYGIFRNLLENSVRYAGEGAKIVMEEYRESDERFYIHYYDTGNGVPDEYLSRLFDRFVRIGEGRSRSDGGTGLGLSIVKHSVQFHNGEIYAKNRKEGGLEYFFSLSK